MKFWRAVSAAVMMGSRPVNFEYLVLSYPAGGGGRGGVVHCSLVFAGSPRLSAPGTECHSVSSTFSRKNFDKDVWT